LKRLQFHNYLLVAKDKIRALRWPGGKNFAADPFNESSEHCLEIRLVGLH
jgi:hypothetical protein